MKVLVCGGRDYADARALNEALDALHRETPITRLIHGAARGADLLAAAWAVSRNVPAGAFRAEWAKHGKSAGFIRNARMLRDGRPGLVMAFPGGKGTAHMVKLARAAGVPVRQVPGMHQPGQAPAFPLSTEELND
jgi:hypothetical protein